MVAGRAHRRVAGSGLGLGWVGLVRGLEAADPSTIDHPPGYRPAA